MPKIYNDKTYKSDPEFRWLSDKLWREIGIPTMYKDMKGADPTKFLNSKFPGTKTKYKTYRDAWDDTVFDWYLERLKAYDLALPANSPADAVDKLTISDFYNWGGNPENFREDFTGTKNALAEQFHFYANQYEPDTTGGETKPTPPAAHAPKVWVEGKGYVVPQSTSYSRGPIFNVGGGVIDTTLGRGPLGGDVIGEGPKNVQSAKKTLRATGFTQAGYDSVATSPGETIQSDALFEAFSWVPDGYGLGPDNALHKLNKQVDLYRFGMEELYQPRTDSPCNPPHGMQPKWMNSMSIDTITDEFGAMVDKKVIDAQTTYAAKRAPPETMDDEYNVLPSSKKLRRNLDGPSFLRPIVDTRQNFKDPFQPPAMLSTRRMRGTLRGTWADYS